MNYNTWDVKVVQQGSCSFSSRQSWWLCLRPGLAVWGDPGVADLEDHNLTRSCRDLTQSPPSLLPATTFTAGHPHSARHTGRHTGRHGIFCSHHSDLVLFQCPSCYITWSLSCLFKISKGHTSHPGSVTVTAAHDTMSRHHIPSQEATTKSFPENWKFFQGFSG